MREMTKIPHAEEAHNMQELKEDSGFAGEAELKNKGEDAGGTVLKAPPTPTEGTKPLAAA